MLVKQTVFCGLFMIFWLNECAKAQLFPQPCCNTQCCCNVCSNCDAAPTFGSGSWSAAGGLGSVSNPCNCQNFTYTCYMYPNTLAPIGLSYGLPPASYAPPPYVVPPQIEPPQSPSPCKKPSCSIIPIPGPQPSPQPCICAVQPCQCINTMGMPIATVDEDIKFTWANDSDFLYTPQGIIILVIVVLLAVTVLCLLLALIIACVKSFCWWSTTKSKHNTVIDSSTQNYQTDEYPAEHRHLNFHRDRRIPSSN